MPPEAAAGPLNHPEFAVYVVIVYAVTFGLLAAYLWWLWRAWQREQLSAQERQRLQVSQASATQSPLRELP